MKFYSESLKNLFDKADDCVEAEEAQKKAKAEAEEKKRALAEQRAARAKEVEDAHQRAVEAKEEYSKILYKFLEDYGSFHATYTRTDPIWSLFDWF